MRGVAIRANRPTLVALGEQLAVDAFFVRLLDADVTFAARLGDVRVVDGRFPVHAAFDVVDAVTVIAGGGDDQAHLEQRPPVNAVQVLRRGRRILHLIFLGEAGVAVALGAGLRERGSIHECWWRSLGPAFHGTRCNLAGGVCSRGRGL